jgi:hypothetical protein
MPVIAAVASLSLRGQSLELLFGSTILLEPRERTIRTAVGKYNMPESNILGV